jgi:D-3-phosphoglycerate dehydrogenase / 2-oxoglutarate reductase
MKILISDTLDDEGIKIFKENGFDVVKNFNITKEELTREIEKFDAIVVRSRTKLTANILEKAKNLKVIGRAGVGLDNIDLKKAKDLGITVLNTPEAPSVSVAELALGMMFSLARYISIADETMHRNEWNKNDYLGYTLHGKKLGLIGFGNIGKELAKRAIALGMKVGVYSRFSKGQSAIDEAKSFGCDIYPSIEETLKDAQIISLHLPATNKTENIINESTLKLMKPNSILINTARGRLVDEEALVKALNNRQIAGAALDVYWEEPLKNQDLINCKDNLILTPHVGSQTEETQSSAATGIAQKISDFLKNK